MGLPVRQRLGRIATHIVLIVGSFLMLLPLLWMLSTSLKSYDQTLAMPPIWIPHPLRWQTYVEAWHTAPFGVYFFNSFYVAIATTAGEVALGIFAAYAFARLNFFGKNLLFVAFLGTMMVPGEVLLIPNYLTLASLGWLNTYYALIVPWLVSVFGIFLLRQHFMTIPNELFEAARLDGCGHTWFLWRVVVPISRPSITTVALFKFIGSWNAFLWVLLVTNSPERRTVPVGLTEFASDVGQRYHQWMAAATLGLLPVLILFLAAQKQFVEGIARSGLKG